MDGTPAYVSLYKVMPKAGQQLKKAAAEIKLKTYLLGMEKESRLLITGKREFVPIRRDPPCQASERAVLSVLL